MARPARKSRGKKQRKPQQKGRAVVSAEKSTKPKSWLSKYGLPGAALLVLVGAVIFTTQGIGSRPKLAQNADEDKADVHPAVYRHAYNTDAPETLDELLALPDDELENLDIAVMNLLCAEGLAGSENIDVAAIQAQLDEWVEKVIFETDRHLYRLTDPRYADRWGGSEAKYRSEFLLQVLQLDCNVHYNEASKFEVDFKQSHHLFIHGLVPNDAGVTHGGTCVSMPVIYAAVGRRLGYPIKLVVTAAHIFCRWEGEDHDNPKWRDRFNIEGSGEGIKFRTDAHYLHWPREVTDQELDDFQYLMTLTPKQELALFLGTRGHNLFDCGRLKEADQTYAQAMSYHPENALYSQFRRDVSEYYARLHPRPTEQDLQRHAELSAWAEQYNRDNQRRLNAHLRNLPGRQPNIPGQPGFDPYR